MAEDLKVGKEGNVHAEQSRKMEASVAWRRLWKLFWSPRLRPLSGSFELAGGGSRRNTCTFMFPSSRRDAGAAVARLRQYIYFGLPATQNRDQLNVISKKRQNRFLILLPL